jgi:hypothetical protein
MYWKIGPQEIVGFQVNFIQYFRHAKQKRMIFSPRVVKKSFLHKLAIVPFQG